MNEYSVDIPDFSCIISSNSTRRACGMRDIIEELCSGCFGPVDKVGYFKIAAKKMTWKPRKEPLQEWDTSISLT